MVLLTLQALACPPMPSPIPVTATLAARPLPQVRRSIIHRHHPVQSPHTPALPGVNLAAPSTYCGSPSLSSDCTPTLNTSPVQSARHTVNRPKVPPDFSTDPILAGLDLSGIDLNPQLSSVPASDKPDPSASGDEILAGLDLSNISQESPMAIHRPAKKTGGTKVTRFLVLSKVKVRLSI